METIILGDSLQELKNIPTESVDAVITDPPYGIAYGGNKWDNPHSLIKGSRAIKANSSQHRKNLIFQEWCEQWIKEVDRILTPEGIFVTFGATRTIARVGAAINTTNLNIIQQSAWYYASGMSKGTNISKYVEAQEKYGNTFSKTLKQLELEGEGETYFIKEKSLGNLRAEKIFERKTYKPSTELGKQWNDWFVQLKPAYEPILFATKQGEYNIPSLFNNKKPTGSEVKLVEGVKHPTVKPLSLMRELISLTTKPDDLIVEPFLGSGTTLEAAIQTKRNIIGIELTEEYLPLIQARIDRNR